MLCLGLSGLGSWYGFSLLDYFDLPIFRFLSLLTFVYIELDFSYSFVPISSVFSGCSFDLCNYSGTSEFLIF